MDNKKHRWSSSFPFEISAFFLIMLCLTFCSFLWEKNCTPNVMLSYAFYGNTNDGEYAFFLPESSLTVSEKGSFVYAVHLRKTIYRDELRVERTDVEILQTEGGLVAIKGNIIPDVQYVSSTDTLLSDGDLVRELK